MIVTQTPLRVSFFGGGSDIPHFFHQSDGVCISTSIDQHISIVANKCATPHVKMMYSEIEIVEDIHDLKHDRVRSVLEMLGISKHVEIASFANIPTKGTGLGSSSSFTVGLIHALRKLYDKRGVSPWDLAEDACKVEIEMCNEPIGMQDQYAAAFGGLTAYEFTPYGVNIRPVHMSAERRFALQNSIMMFSTNTTRRAWPLLQDQINQNKTQHMGEIVEIARQSLKHFERGDINMIGELLHHGWEAKKKTSVHITTPFIDMMYDEGRKAGAIGGKLLGAGAGGYVMFFVPSKKRQAVEQVMAQLGCAKLPFVMTDRGSTVHVIQ